VVLLGANKERHAEANDGTGKEVSTESVADAGDWRQLERQVTGEEAKETVTS
jgi:hypothetical protein